jgi:hypothetical protein
MTRSDLLAAALGLAGLALGAAAVAGGPATVPTVEPPARLAPVRSALLDCPAAASSGAATSSLAALSAPVPVPDPGDVDGPDTAGSLRLFSGTRAGGPPSMLSKRGRVVEVTAGASARAVGRIVASGELAPGATGWRVDRARAGLDRGLAVASCAAPTTSWWFVGTASRVGHVGRLLLTNPEPGPAAVDIDLFGPDGQVAVAGGRGVSLAPRSSRVVALSSLAIQEPGLAVHVQATQGEVVAVVHDRWADGVTPTGNEWLGPVTPPGGEVVVPGLPKCGGAAQASAQLRSSCGKSTRTLVVANPGALTALVRVEVLGPRGPFVPSGLETLRIPPTSVVRADVTAVARGEPAGIRLTSDQDVTAAVLIADGSAQADTAVVPASPPLAGPAAAPWPTDLQASLLLSSAARTAAAARISVYAADGARLLTDTVPVAGGSTRQWTLPRLRPAERRSVAYVVVEPTSGSVTAAAVYRAEPVGLAGLALRSLAVSVERPAVRLTLASS